MAHSLLHFPVGVSAEDEAMEEKATKEELVKEG